MVISDSNKILRDRKESERNDLFKIITQLAHKNKKINQQIKKRKNNLFSKYFLLKKEIGLIRSKKLFKPPFDSLVDH